MYYDNSHETRFKAVVRSCDQTPGGFETVLDKTLFYPEGGGQPHDTGGINGARVLDVRERGGVVIHLTDKPLETGTVADCEVDWERRFGFMQQHTGEHIVSGLLRSMFGIANKGFHIGAEFTTIDTDKPVSQDVLDAVEIRANKAVYANLPVKAFYPGTDALLRMDYRSKLDDTALMKNDVRVIEIPGVDICTCCGVLCAATGEVGIVKLLYAQAYKGGARIYMLFRKRDPLVHSRAVRYPVEKEKLARGKAQYIRRHRLHLPHRYGRIKRNIIVAHLHILKRGQAYPHRQRRLPLVHPMLFRQVVQVYLRPRPIFPERSQGLQSGLSRG